MNDSNHTTWFLLGVTPGQASPESKLLGNVMTLLITGWMPFMMPKTTEANH